MPRDVAKHFLWRFSDRADCHRRTMECDKKKMAFTRPSSGMRRLESTRSPLPHFAARTGYEIVDAVPAGVLKVVFVTAETCANAARLEQRNNGRHSIGVAML